MTNETASEIRDTLLVMIMENVDRELVYGCLRQFKSQPDPRELALFVLQYAPKELLLACVYSLVLQNRYTPEQIAEAIDLSLDDIQHLVDIFGEGLALFTMKTSPSVIN